MWRGHMSNSVLAGGTLCLVLILQHTKFKRRYGVGCYSKLGPLYALCMLRWCSACGGAETICDRFCINRNATNVFGSFNPGLARAVTTPLGCWVRFTVRCHPYLTPINP